MSKFYLPLLAVCLGVSLTATAQNRLEPLDLNVPSAVLSGFTDYEIVSLDHSSIYGHYRDGGETIKLEFSTPSGPLSFTLDRWDQRTPDHRLVTTGGNVLNNVVARRPAAQYRGHEQSPNGGVAVFTLDEKFTLGSWQHEGVKTHLEPLFRLWPAAPRDAYLLYRAENVKPITDGCAVVTPPGVTFDRTPAADKAAGECFEVEIALAADFELFQQFGSAASVENFMLGVLADVQTNYDDEFEDEIQFLVSSTEIVTTNAEDPWTNSTDVDDLINDFAAWGNDGGFANDYDVASLWSGRNFDGSTIGYASVRALCSFGRYNILQNYTVNANSLRVLWAHELGHNFGSFHDDAADGFSFIMAPSVNGATEWSAQSINAITAHYQSVNCLTNCVPPTPPQAAFFLAENNVCAGSQLAFFNETTGRVNGFSWEFPGGSPASSGDAYPVVTYATPGTYTATLTVTNQFGSTQENVVINVSDPAEAERNLVFYENFEEGARFMDVVNPDDSTTWILATVPGTRGEVVAYVDNFNNDLRGESDLLITPPLNFAGLTSPRVELEYAYRRYNANFNDGLNVRVSVEGGPYDLVFEGLEDGSMNFATQPDGTSIFVPGGGEDWCGSASGQSCISVDLSAYIGMENVVVAIENINGYGNLMFVDNIAVFGNCASVLPVEWLSFTARVTGKTARLEWAVNQDESHAGFYVERSPGGDAGWRDLGWVPATSNQFATATYEFTDESTGPGQTYYYRLRQRNLNGSESLSEVRTVSFPLSDGVAVWPNPTGGLVQVRNGVSAGDYQLFNSLGQRLLAGKLSEGDTGLDLGQFAAGVYLLRVDAGDEERVFRIVRK